MYLMRALSLYSGANNGMSGVIFVIAKRKLGMSGLLCAFNLMVTRLLEAVSDTYVVVSGWQGD